MQALQFSAAGKLGSLQLRDLPVPIPGAGEVLVEVRAAGLNPSSARSYRYVRCSVTKNCLITLNQLADDNTITPGRPTIY